MRPTRTTPAPGGPISLPIAAAWSLGFVLVVNLYLLPGRDNSPRLTDALGAALWLWAAARLCGPGFPGRIAAAIGLLTLLPVIWGAHAATSGLLWTAAMSARWVLAAPFALALAMAAGGERSRRALLWGLWWGVVVNLAVLGAQYLGWRDATIASGLAAAESELVWGTTFVDRNPGLHGHANATAAVVSLAVPIALLLQLRHRAGLLVLPASFLMVLLASHVTATRAPLVVATLSLLAVAATSGRLKRGALAVLLAALAALPFYLVMGAPGGRVRWTDSAHTSANYQERIGSNLSSIAIALENPLGLGLERSEEAMEEASAPASHNAFLQIGMVYGPAFGLLLLVLLGSLALRLLNGPYREHGPEALLALQVCGLFFFEEHLRNPTFVIVTLWLGATALTAWTESLAPALLRPDGAPPPERA